ncbi:hypothetical protein QJ857_gp0810 [Tupanvirus soda lake]|uniref:Uncharacterized protein n=2 Tax=Tupanvirus TaxID=2094720 RepID=A0A6N1NKN8_9VIRU|nr:hypothetical protein QJ857_gp0810 [Tupanvirus soda lake]QKU35239.1 hypothetical protein [Tupanvirus soda lake]
MFLSRFSRSLTHSLNINKHQVRYYVSDTDMKNIFKKSQIVRVSIYEPRTNELISFIRNGEYNKAELLVKKQNVNVNGHNCGENTPLTDAAKRGDTKAVEFLIKHLNANPHASCDCPQHKTALHYASENGHLNTVKTLLKLGANPMVRDSKNYKALDFSKNKNISDLLKSYESKNQNCLPRIKENNFPIKN